MSFFTRRLDLNLLFSLIALFAILFSALALNRHNAFQTNGFDLGNVNQAIWHTAQGQLLVFTNMAPVSNRLALHVEPILFLFVPFYWLGLGGARFLLVAQAIVVCLGAWPLYYIAKPKLSQWAGLIICLAYLLYPALEAAMMYDFHAVTLAPTFLLATFYFLEKTIDNQDKAFRGFVLFALLAMACKEDMGLIIGMMGLYVALAHRLWRLGLTIVLVGFGWSTFAVLGIQTQFGGNVQAGRYNWLFTAVWQPQQIWVHLWQQADAAQYLWGLLVPVSGFALLSPLTLLPILPSLALNLLSSQGFQWRLEEFHYAAPIAPFIFISAIYGMRRLTYFVSHLWKNALRYLPLILGLIVLSSSGVYQYYRGFSPLARPFQWRTVTTHHQLGQEIAQSIPLNVPLLAPLNLNPHVSSRPILHQTFNSRTVDDWLWLDVSTLPNENYVQQFIRDDLLWQYQVVEAVDGFLLLKPGTFDGGITDQFHTYANPIQSVSPAYPVSIFFNEVLELMGYDLVFNRAEEVQVRTYWRSHGPLPPDLEPTLFLLDDDGDYLGASDEAHLPATLVWFPTQLWPQGQTMVVDFNSANWHTRDRAAYRLGIGVVPFTPSNDPWDVVSRWRPKVVESKAAPILTVDGTVVELAQIQQVAGMLEGGPSQRLWQQPAIAHPINTVFGGQIRFIGYDTIQVDQTATSPTLLVRLVWQAVDVRRENFIRFVHVVGSDGHLLGQVDSSPLNGSYPPNLWAENEYVVETVTVPLTTQPANYTVHIGFYQPELGERLLDEQGRDHIEIR